MALDEKTTQTLKNTLDNLLEKMLECKKNGHKEPKDLPYTWDSVSGLEAKGYCTYCCQFYDRELTRSERKDFEKFKKSLYEPMI